MVRMRYFLWVIVLGCATMQAVNAKDRPSDDIVFLSNWIASLQFTNQNTSAFGGLRIHHTVAAKGADGTPYFRVSPYNSNLAVLGLLRTGTPESLQTAQRWILWYFNHLTPQSAPDGVPLEHFYAADGKSETTCVKPDDARLCHFNDATDSAAATFFCVLESARQAGLANSVLIENRTKIEALAATLLQLQQPDGLCWAKANYRAKYLEDNCEVFAGLRDLAALERAAFHDEEKARLYEQAAAKVKTAILTELYDSVRRLYHVAKFENGTFHQANLATWYPDMQAQMWPHLWGVVTPQDEKTRHVINALDALWNGVAKPDWDTNPQAINGGSIESGVALAVCLAKDTTQTRNYMAAVKQWKYPANAAGNNSHNFAWPFPISDAGWLIALMKLSAP